MTDFAGFYVGRLRLIHDMETQMLATLPVIETHALDGRLLDTLRRFETQSKQRLNRLARAFELLYLVPTGNSCWVTTALLRQAWDAAANCADSAQATQACAAALLALKRHEMVQYETMMRWSQQISLDEVVADFRRSLAETIVQGAMLSDFAFQSETPDHKISVEKINLHPHAVH
jgi:ferritin-like metal-binding protein YciE